MKNKNRINYEKIAEIKKMNFRERWNSKVKIGELIDLRTNEDITYHSKFEVWNERRKDMSDMFAIGIASLWPFPVDYFLNVAIQIAKFPLDLAMLPLTYVNEDIQYSEERGGVVWKE